MLSSLVVLVHHGRRSRRSSAQPRLGPRQRRRADRHRRGRHGHPAEPVRSPPTCSASTLHADRSRTRPRSRCVVARGRPSAPAGAARSCAASSSSRLPILVLAGLVDVLAGMTIEKRIESFLTFPALLVLVPPFLEDSGSLGAILAGAGLDPAPPGNPRRRAGRRSRAASTTCCSCSSTRSRVRAARAVGRRRRANVANSGSPGVAARWSRCSVIAGFMATAFAVVVGFYSAVFTHRLGLDPDNHGIPIVTSTLDLFGALSLILAIVLLGLRLSTARSTHPHGRPTPKSEGHALGGEGHLRAHGRSRLRVAVLRRRRAWPTRSSSSRNA